MPKFNLEHFKHIPIDIPLFVLKKDNRVSYLLGTAHDIPLEALPLPYHTILKTIQTFIGESEPRQILTEQVLLELGLITTLEGEGFKQLSEKAQRVLKEKFGLFLSGRNCPPISAARIEPGFAHLICEFSEQSGGMDEQLETLFALKRHGLEKRQEQIFFTEKNKISLDHLEWELINGYAEGISYPEEDMLSYSNYLMGSIIYDFSFIRENSEDESDEMMNTSRNLLWMPKILKYLQELDSPALIAVGAGHLVGEKGLLNLLFEAGFELSVLNAKGESKPYSTHLVKNEIVKYTNLPGYFVKLIGEYADECVVKSESTKNTFTPSYAQKACDSNVKEEKEAQKKIFLDNLDHGLS